MEKTASDYMNFFALFTKDENNTLHGKGSTLFVTENVNEDENIRVMKNSNNAKFILYDAKAKAVESGTTTQEKKDFMKIQLPHAIDKIEIDACISIGLQQFFENPAFGYLEKFFPSYIGVIKLADQSFIQNRQDEEFNVIAYKNKTYLNAKTFSKTFVTKAVVGAHSLGDLLSTTTDPIQLSNIMAHLDYFCNGLYTLSLQTGFAHNDMHFKNILFDNNKNNFVLIDMGSAYIDLTKIEPIPNQESIEQARYEYNEAFSRYFDMVKLISDNNVDEVYAEELKMAIHETEIKQNKYAELKKKPISEVNSEIEKNEIEKKLRNAIMLLNTNITKNPFDNNIKLKTQCFTMFGDANHTRYTNPGRDFVAFNQHAVMNDIAGLCLFMFINSKRCRTFFIEKDDKFDIFDYKSLKIPVAITEILRTKTGNATILEYGLRWAIIYIHTFCRYTCQPIFDNHYFIKKEIMSGNSPLFFTFGQMRTPMFNQLKTDFSETLTDLNFLSVEDGQSGGQLNGDIEDKTINQYPIIYTDLNNSSETKEAFKIKLETNTTKNNYQDYVKSAHLFSVRNVCDDTDHYQMPRMPRINIENVEYKPTKMKGELFAYFALKKDEFLEKNTILQNKILTEEQIKYIQNKGTTATVVPSTAQQSLGFDEPPQVFAQKIQEGLQKELQEGLKETPKGPEGPIAGGAPLDRQKSRMIRGVKYVKKGKKMIRAKI